MGEGGDSLKVLVKEKCKRKSSNKDIKKKWKEDWKNFSWNLKKKKGKGKWLDLIYIYTISICVFRSRSVSIIKAAPLFSVEFSLLSWVNLTHKITQTGFIHTYIHAPTHPRIHSGRKREKIFSPKFCCTFFSLQFPFSVLFLHFNLLLSLSFSP